MLIVKKDEQTNRKNKFFTCEVDDSFEENIIKKDVQTNRINYICKCEEDDDFEEIIIKKKSIFYL